MTTRENNLDLLRVIAAILVVMLHVCIRPTAYAMVDPFNQFSLCNLFNALSRIAVPLFVLMSGYFLLSQNKNKSFSYFYKKTLFKVILPTLLANFIYFYYSQLINSLFSINTRSLSVLSIFKEPGFYHLWYLYMLIGLYLCVPFLIHLKQKIGEKSFLILGLLFLLLDMVLIYFNESFWPTRFINYLGYFILGHSIHYYHSRYLTQTSYFCIGALIAYSLTVIGTEVIVRCHLAYDPNKKLILYGNLSPFIVIASLCTFIVFLNLPNKPYKLQKLAPYTFMIYILHAGILSPIDKLLNLTLKLAIYPLFYIPLLTIFVFISSCVLSIGIKKLTSFQFYSSKSSLFSK